MKRVFLVFLVLALVAGMVSCKKTPEIEPPPKDEMPNDRPQDTLIIGCESLGGSFIPGFTTILANQWVVDLLYGYSPYVMTADGTQVGNETVVKDLVIELDQSGNKVYTFTIHDDLKWSDGTGISASDYVFSYLWQNHPLWQEMGAVQERVNLLGCSDYCEGRQDRLKGIKTVGDYSFSLTIDKDHVGFWETQNVMLFPLPMKIWAPGCSIQQDDDGAKLEDENLEAHFAQIASEELLGCAVTSGPFLFKNLDEDQLILQANPYFKGTYAGKTPRFEHVVIRWGGCLELLDQCIAGEIDAVIGTLYKEEFERALASENIEGADYICNGFTGIFYHCDFGPTKNPKVRQALAFLIDRNVVMEEMIEGDGYLADGYYSPSQWMYKDNKVAMDALTHFTLDIAEANKRLDETEWRFEADGSTPFNPEKAVAGGYFRYNPKGEVLAINHFTLETCMVADGVKYLYGENAPKAGID